MARRVVGCLTVHYQPLYEAVALMPQPRRGAAVSLAHSMCVRVNAAGVASGLPLAALQKRGCDQTPGFLRGQPAAPQTLLHVQAPARGPERPVVVTARSV